ncbi:hypothetical protein C8A01DRAFT_42257 [Parachaetomium inaequale]|uniref:Uncharacterized protein n=1 Tax=Parachaetomium inaequale TaxID=2588326 RepID=A0AAN6P463_9PEZI|nr:hypothetical protein C8A01DRAFT_42257 [Parachaetomium inaequale]
MATVSLDNQIFYDPAMATGPKPASRGLSVRKAGPSPSPPPQDAHNLQHGGAERSQVDVILISDDELDNGLDLDGQSDTSFESLDWLRPAPTGNGVDAASDDSNEPEHPKLSAYFRRCRGGESSQAKVDNEDSEGDEPEPADAGTPLQPPSSQGLIDFWRDVGGQRSPAVPPPVVESRARTPTPLDDESTGELEPADTEPPLQPQSPSGAAPGHGADLRQRSGNCRLSQHRDHSDDNDQASDLEHCAPDDRGESVASSPTLLDDESTGEPEPADAELSLPP